VNPYPDTRTIRLAAAGLLSGAVMISFSGVWVKIAHVTSTASAFYRVFFGSIFLLMAVLGKGELKPKKIPNLWLAVCCGFLFALDLYFFHISIRYVGPGLGTILPNFQVFILAAIGIIFFKEKARLAYLLSIPLAFFGLFLIIGLHWGRMDPLYRIGVYCGLATAVCYAGFILSLRKLQADQIGSSIFYVLMVASMASSAFLAVEIWRAEDTFKIPDLQSLIALASLGLFSQSVGWILIANALPKIQASLSGLILLLQPALAFTWDVLFFHRPTTWINWAGVGIVLVAIYFGTVYTNRVR
jgi:drug/metabolite transporter (DMT)-like permease